ncbi:MAG: DNA-directed RNA polymerase subunit omega [Candidatus Omnitrophica bacterium]|nr:DNA-directed RNA polymerase subunit omega [Candidatus Omnitrophota bacterium]
MAGSAVYIPIEPLLEKVGSIYKLVIIAARRALELNDGAPRLVDADAKAKPSTVALAEIAAGKVSVKLREKRKKDEL